MAGADSSCNPAIARASKRGAGRKPDEYRGDDSPKEAKTEEDSSGKGRRWHLSNGQGQLDMLLRRAQRGLPSFFSLV